MEFLSNFSQPQKGTTFPRCQLANEVLPRCLRRAQSFHDEATNCLQLRKMGGFHVIMHPCTTVKRLKMHDGESGEWERRTKYPN